MAVVINSTTGEIDLDQTTPGIYVVTYTVQGVSSTQDVTVNAVDDATFSYSASAFCADASNQTPTITTPGGTFTTQDITFYPLQLQFSVTSGVEKTISVGITGTSYTIDWGDGTVETSQTAGTKSHTYNPGGSGTITNPTISIGAESDTGPVSDFTIPTKSDLLDIIRWGSLVYTGNWNLKFYFTNNLVTPITATDYPNIYSVDTFTGLFQQSSFNGDMSNWVFNTTGLTNNSTRMFYLASSFNQDVSSWNVSGFDNFSTMFRLASSFSKNLSNWYINGFSPFLSTNTLGFKFMFWDSAMTSEHFTDTIVGWAVAVHRDSGPYNVVATTLAPNPFIATRTQDTDNSGNTIDYSTKYGSDWDSNWTNAGHARQFLLDNGWSIS